jgi:hypothetical protein
VDPQLKSAAGTELLLAIHTIRLEVALRSGWGQMWCARRSKINLTFPSVGAGDSTSCGCSFSGRRGGRIPRIKGHLTSKSCRSWRNFTLYVYNRHDRQRNLVEFTTRGNHG